MAQDVGNTKLNSMVPSPTIPELTIQKRIQVLFLKKKKKSVVNADKKMLSEKLYLRDYTNLGGSEKDALNSDFET